jgi:hypothetical protein
MASEKTALPPAEEPFLSRWSRLKRETAATTPEPVEPAAPSVTEPLVLPSVDSLTPDSDFSIFMQPGVQANLRQAALRKLFADPHFNVMDGLDIYIDDYTLPDPIAAEIVEQLAQYRSLGGVQQDPEKQVDPGGQGAEPERTTAASGMEPPAEPGHDSAAAMIEDTVSHGDPGRDKMSLASAESGQDVAIRPVPQ